MQSGTAFNTLLQQMPVGLIVWQLDDDLATLRLVCANPSAEALCGVPLAQHLGERMTTLLPWVSSAREREYVEIARTGVLGVIVPLADTHSVQTVFSVRALAIPEQCVGVIFQDLAEQNGELAKREERFRTLIQNSNDALVLADANGLPTFVSDTVTQVLGYRPADVVGLDSFTLMHPDDIEPTRAQLAQALARPGQSVTHEVRMRHADGSWRTLEVVTTNHLEDPNVGAIVANFRDISDRKLMEQALHRTQEQLLHAQKMEAIGRLAGGIAHDFNNLLSVVLSYADILLAKNALQMAHDDLREIRKAGMHAAELTYQLLAFSRKQILAPRVVNVNATLSSIADMIRRLVGEHIELRLVPATELWDVRVDPGQLEQVLMNLVVNARDAMPDGGTLTIETGNAFLDEAYEAAHMGATRGPSVMLAVSDTGLGMDPATRERIFEPFFTTKEQGKGTGLGLSTAFGIVNQSGGSIWVYSEVGKGTTFKVYLPKTEAAQGVVQRESEAPPAARDNETILLVEDDASVRAVTRKILERQGYLVLEAASGPEALVIAAEADGLKLLLTDVVMPRMSGRELAEQLSKTRPALKVLFVSGYTDDTIVHHGVLDEDVAFLQKPITPGALARKVRTVLDS